MSRNIPAAFILFALSFASGCGQSGAKTVPVQGKIQLATGDVKNLAGSYVEASLVGEPTVRASGVIQSDGSFRLESRHGRHEVRIILADDDRETQRRAAKAIPARYRDFKTSGLSFEAPANGEVVLSIAAR